MQQISKPPRKLPPLTAFIHALNSVRTNLAFALRISWPVYAILLPIVLGGNLLIENLATSPEDLLPYIITMAEMACGLVAFSIIAVHWHRYILRDEVPAQGTTAAITPEAWRYVGNLLLITLVTIAGAMVAAVVIAAFSGAREEISLSMLPQVIALAVIIGFVVMRFSVKFPAVALGRRDFSFAAAWRATAGNSLEILAYVVLNGVVVFLVGFAAAMIVKALMMVNPTLASIADVALQLGANWLLTIFSCSALTSLYGYFVENRDY